MNSNIAGHQRCWLGHEAWQITKESWPNLHNTLRFYFTPVTVVLIYSPRNNGNSSQSIFPERNNFLLDFAIDFNKINASSS